MQLVQIPVIAKITQPDGTVVDIHSQILPPAPNLKQHQNQVIEPVMGTLKLIQPRGWVYGQGDYWSYAGCKHQ